MDDDDKKVADLHRIRVEKGADKLMEAIKPAQAMFRKMEEARQLYITHLFNIFELDEKYGDRRDVVAILADDLQCEDSEVQRHHNTGWLYLAYYLAKEQTGRPERWQAASEVLCRADPGSLPDWREMGDLSCGEYFQIDPEIDLQIKRIVDGLLMFSADPHYIAQYVRVLRAILKFCNLPTMREG